MCGYNNGRKVSTSFQTAVNLGKLHYKSSEEN